MATTEQLLERLDALMSKGQAVLATRRNPSPNVMTTPYVDGALFAEWTAQATNYLVSVLGPEAIYTLSFRDAASRAHLPEAAAGMGVLAAVRDDLERGYLTDLRAAITAEVFTDFLDMAKHLLAEGLYHPAASLAGAVLEDGLRQIALANKVPWKPMDGAGAISSLLQAKGVHPALVQSQLRSAIAVRDAADHGQFDQVSREAVTVMVATVESYLAAHLGQ